MFAGDIRPGNALEDLGRDIRYAFRTIGKSPLFVLVVVLMLALGIGANTTVFTMINTLILNPLPVSDTSRLAAVGLSAAENLTQSSTPLPISNPDLRDYQTRNAVFDSFAGYTSPRVVTLQEGGASQGMFAELVHVVFTVIGVAPPGFIGLNAIFGPEVWIPAAMTEQVLPGELQAALTDRGKGMLLGIGRLKAGVTRAMAQANMTTLAADLAREYPAENEGHTVTVRPLGDDLFGSAAGGSATIVFAGAILLAVVGIVLLIACSNVANLLLARSAARQQEIAVRLAMGASRPRLVRQLLTESVLLGCAGGVLGMGFGYAGLRLLFGTLPGAATFVAPKFDGTVFICALAISLATGLLFGAAPAFQASRTGVAEALKQEARTTGGNGRRVSLANALLVGQVAFSFVLLVTAALFLRSIQRAYDIDPGFQTAHLALFMTNPGPAGYDKARAMAFYKEARERAAALPGVESVSWSANLPLWGRTVTGLQVEGRQERSRADKVRTIVNTVGRDYFETAGVVIERGREFTDADLASTTPVAIVNEKLARDYWRGGEALGKRIQVPGEKQMRRIAGIARTANYTTWAEAPQLCVYLPLEQNYSDAMTMYVRSHGDPRQVLIPVQRAILAGLLALGLASIGLYGIMAYSVHRRKREIGLRMALGAARSSLLRLVLKEGMTPVLAGVLIGLPASMAVGHLLSKMLFGISSGDPLSVTGAALVLFAVALLACYLPARRASRLDPWVALREG